METCRTRPWLQADPAWPTSQWVSWSWQSWRRLCSPEGSDPLARPPGGDKWWRQKWQWWSQPWLESPATWRILLHSSSHTAAPRFNHVVVTNDHEDDDLCALIDHEADGVCEAVAAASNLPACVDHVDLSLDLISDSSKWCWLWWWWWCWFHNVLLLMFIKTGNGGCDSHGSGGTFSKMMVYLSSGICCIRSCVRKDKI